MNKFSAVWSAPTCKVLSGNLGERYGKPLLACAIDNWVMCSIRQGGVQKTSNLKFLHIEKGVKDYLKLKSIPFQVRPYHLQITRENSVNIVAITACFLEFFTGRSFPVDEINRLSFHIQKKSHKTELGYQTSVSCFGGLIYARREFEFLKVINTLPLKISPSLLKHLFYIHHKKPIDADKQFGKLYNKRPKQMDEYLNIMEKNTRKMTVAIASEQVQILKQSLESSQKIYEEIDLMPEGAALFFQDKKGANNYSKIHKIQLIPLKVTYAGLHKVKV